MEIIGGSAQSQNFADKWSDFRMNGGGWRALREIRQAIEQITLPQKHKGNNPERCFAIIGTISRMSRPFPVLDPIHVRARALLPVHTSENIVHVIRPVIDWV